MFPSIGPRLSPSNPSTRTNYKKLLNNIARAKSRLRGDLATAPKDVGLSPRCQRKHRRHEVRTSFSTDVDLPVRADNIFAQLMTRLAELCIALDSPTDTLCILPRVPNPFLIGSQRGKSRDTPAPGSCRPSQRQQIHTSMYSSPS